MTRVGSQGHSKKKVMLPYLYTVNICCCCLSVNQLGYGLDYQGFDSREE